MLYGYALNNHNQSELNHQINALNALQCDEIIINDAHALTPFADIVAKFSPGDCLAVFRLDYLGYGITQLNINVSLLAAGEVLLTSVADGIHCAQSSSIIYSIIAGMADIYSDLNQD